MWWSLVLQYDSEDVGARPWRACQSCRHHRAPVDDGGGRVSVEIGVHSTHLSRNAHRRWPLLYSPAHCRRQDCFQRRRHSVCKNLSNKTFGTSLKVSCWHSWQAVIMLTEGVPCWLDHVFVWQRRLRVVLDCGGSNNFEKGGGRRQFISIVVIYRRCSQRNICLLRGKSGFLKKKNMSQ